MNAKNILPAQLTEAGATGKGSAAFVTFCYFFSNKFLPLCGHLRITCQ